MAKSPATGGGDLDKFWGAVEEPDAFSKPFTVADRETPDRKFAIEFGEETPAEFGFVAGIILHCNGFYNVEVPILPERLNFNLITMR